MTKPTSVEDLSRWNREFFALIPLHQAMDIRVGRTGAGWAEMSLPFRADLVGDPTTGMMHGGAITALVDACCGAAVFMSLGQPQGLATLDLRIDYLRRPEPNADVHAFAQTIRRTHHVAFVRGEAWHQDREHPIASVTGAFKLGTHVPGVTSR